MAEQKQQLPGIIVLLRESFALYAAHAGLFLRIVAVPTGIYAILSISFYFLNQYLFFLTGQSLTAYRFIWVYVLAIIFLPFFTWSHFAMVLSLSHKKDTFLAAYKRALPKVWPGFLIAVLIQFSIIGSVLFFVLPFLYFAVCFNLAGYVYLFENQKGIQALRTSRQYIIGRWWSVAWRVFVTLLLPFLLFLSNVLWLRLGVKSLEVRTIIQEFIAIILAPWTVMYTYLLYKAVKKTAVGVSVPTPSEEKKAFYWLLAGLGVAILIWYMNFLFHLPTVTPRLKRLPSPTPRTMGATAVPYSKVSY